MRYTRAENAARARKAAELYLKEDIELKFCCERFDVSWDAAWMHVKRIRARLRAERSATAGSRA